MNAASAGDARPGASTIAAWERAAESRILAGLGRRLRQLGLTESAVAACFGVRCPGHAPRAFLARHGGAMILDEVAPAAVLPYLFVAGALLPADVVAARLGEDCRLLCQLGLVRIVQGEKLAWATVAMLPVGQALVVSDRADASPTGGQSDIALFCDDSAFHTLGALPPRPLGPGARWLDIGTGSAIAPLARPDIAETILGSDINPRAIAMARLGAALSAAGSQAERPRPRPELVTADLLDAARDRPPWHLITFNAPIPQPVATREETGPRSLYRVGAADLLPRLWAGARAALAPGGEVLVHSWQPETGYPASLGLRGQVVAVRYTPPGASAAFGVTSWRPDEPDRCYLVTVPLTTRAPHIARNAFALPQQDRR